jgi:mannose-1-phosphate guanylyltransferase
MDHDLLKSHAARERNEWAVILAGGDGTRLKSLTRKIAGDERPKQFCPVLGKRSLLEETQRRAALQIAPERTLYLVNQLHENYYTPILSTEPASNLIVQPNNRGTAPAILYSLLRIASVDSNALVAFLPSDHYVSDNEKFMAHMRLALDTARYRRDLVILLGLEPDSPETGYGWIEPAEAIHGTSRVFGVTRFWEKPNHLLAQLLQLRGCLWNSFVMVASVEALLEIIKNSIPDLYRSFARLNPHFGTRGEAKAIDTLYASIAETNFSHEVLALRPQRLAVLRVTGVRWNDLGEPKRVLASLDMAGVRPHWADTVVPQFA